MKKYYTRVCNFYYGSISKNLVKKNKTIPLNGDAHISFDHIEILSRDTIKKIHIKDVKKLSKDLAYKVKKDIKTIKKKYINCSIDIIVRPDLIEIAKMMPEVNNIYSLDVEHNSLGLTKRYRLAKILKKNHKLNC